MPIILDHQLREQVPHGREGFPITFFRDELAELPNRTGPLHWHPDFEIVTAVRSVLDFQVGQRHITLHPGDSIFVNGNVLHGVRQLGGDKPDPMPNIVFSGALVAPETSAVYQKYIRPIARCDALPCIVFGQKAGWHAGANHLVWDIYRAMEEQGPCYEMAVQRALSNIFEAITLHFDELPRSGTERIKIDSQVRLQKMLTYIYEHYAGAVTLGDIAAAAGISRSEAGRCFNAYMGCSPVEALIQYRLGAAHSLLKDSAMTLQEISGACGFNSVSYFSRKFRQVYGYAPGQARVLGK